MIYEEYIASDQWRCLRKQAIERDGGRCRVCNSTEDLEVRHRMYPKRWDMDCVDALTTLCRDCNKVITDEWRGRRRVGTKLRVRSGKADLPGGKALFLCNEQGHILGMQKAIEMKFEATECPTVTVSFYCDGEYVFFEPECEAQK